MEPRYIRRNHIKIGLVFVYSVLPVFASIAVPLVADMNPQRVVSISLIIYVAGLFLMTRFFRPATQNYSPRPL